LAVVCRHGPNGTDVAELLVDTDVCIDHLAGVRRLPRGPRRLGYSVITRAELLAGAEGDDERTVRRLLAGMDEIPVDRRVADRAGLLRRGTPSLRMPDALIAASAIVHSMSLCTKNVKDFKGIPALRLHRR
jgi:predicted nucleic acid-binding protein